MERKFLDFSLPGVNVPRNESSTGAKVLSMVFSLPWTKVQRNEKASYRLEWDGSTNKYGICRRHFATDCFVNARQVEMGFSSQIILMKSAFSFNGMHV